VPAIAASLLARATRGDPGAEARALITALVRVARPDGSVTFLERASELAGQRSRGARFVPPSASLDDGGARLHAEGTLVLHRTCSPLVAYDRFVLDATATTLRLEHAAVARETLTTRCL
jgi:hypothetical protein